LCSAMSDPDRLLPIHLTGLIFGVWE